MGDSLSCEGLAVSSGGRTLVEGVSLAVHPGTVVALLGPNGAGKSSLLKAFAGHPDYPITAGFLRLGDAVANDFIPEDRARRGLFLAFQHPVDLPGVTVAQMLRRARQAQLGSDFDVMAFQKELYAALDALGMGKEWLNRGVNEGFSGGERKRCELLQILSLKPRHVLLDEIDSGLDVDTLELLISTLDGLRRRGTGILLVTHYQRLLERLIPDAVHVLIGGRLVRSGTAELAREVCLGGFQGMG
jgi:Fe-S cluster assembly ATP-binding protein